jgi:hypothetical protein
VVSNACSYRYQLGDDFQHVCLRETQKQRAVDRAWLDPDGSKVWKGQNREPVCVFAFAPTPMELTRECSLLNTACQKIQRPEVPPARWPHL